MIILSFFLFQEKVNLAKVSDSLDAPEGGFDAIMQAIACKVCQIYIQNNARGVHRNLHNAG